MKLLLAPVIVVAFIITSSSLVTALLMGNDTRNCSTLTNGIVTVVCQKEQQGNTGAPGPRVNLTHCEIPTSCKVLFQCNPALPSGYYNISTPKGVKSVYCNMSTSNCGDITGGWMKVAYFDMTSKKKTCPPGLINTTENTCPTPPPLGCPPSLKHICTRSYTDKYGCSNGTLETHGVSYSMVCGQARGYQYRYTPAFRGSHYDGEGFRYARPPTVDDAYVSGLSVTYGSPRNHIWTFAAGWSKTHKYYTTNCPCAVPYPGPDAPPFVGENYFCESGIKGSVENITGRRWHFGDPLWDSNKCADGSNCCKRNRPWFNTSVTETSDDIEVRMCHYFDYRTENIGVELLEIYIY